MAAPPSSPTNEDLLAAVEGARAFREAEELLARGDWQAAREAYLANGSATSHPFAATRLLSLLVLDPRFHDEALDLAAHWLSRRPGFASALLTEGVLRAQRAETAPAARAFAELAAVSARRSEDFGALAAAEACFSLGDEADPAAAARAIETALSLRRDHLPALRMLLAVAERAGDREALLRACRRLAAYAPDDIEKAHAHARLAEMLLRTDAPSARLHLDQALRLAPDDITSVSALARACEQAGEHLRALRAHDRLREIHLARGDREAAARTSLTVGTIWEERLGHPENALLRYREACELLPDSAEAQERAARVADSLGIWVEAADHYAGLLAALSPDETQGSERAAHAHRALARITEEQLNDPARATSHLEAVLTLEPQDISLLEKLAALYRSLERPAELLGVLDRLAPLIPSGTTQTELFTEAGTICVALEQSEAALSRFAAALAHDPECRPALEGIRRIAFDRGDVQIEREVLAKLASTVGEPTEQATFYDQLAQACERAGDLTAAGHALASARQVDPSAVRLAEAVRLARLAHDGLLLASLLVEQAQAAQAADDLPTAVQAWMERAALLGPSDPATALTSLTQARTLAPDSPAVLQAQADLAETAGDLPLALSALRALLATGTLEAGAIELRAARVARAAGDLSSAREHAERAFDSGENTAATLLSEILEASGDRAGQATLLERTGRFLDAARTWHEAGAPERACAALERAAEETATAEQALPALADARLTTGDRSGAATALLRWAHLRGGTEGAQIALRAAETDPSHASEALDLAVASDPSFLPGRVARARHAAESDPVRALSDCEAVFAVETTPSPLDPADHRALRRLAASLAHRLERGEEARRHLLLYCDEAPDDEAALWEVAQLSRAAGDDGSLAAALERRLRQALGAEATAIRVELAQLQLRRDGPLEALKILREALTSDPSSSIALETILGDGLRAHLPALERAELLALQAALPEITDAQKAEALLEQAQILAAADVPDHLTAALTAAQQAVRLQPQNVSVLERVADLAHRSGDTRTAAQALLARARLACETNEPDAAIRLAFAGHTALAAELTDPGEEVLREALALGLDRDETRLAWSALTEQARRRQDGAAEQAGLMALLPLLRTGERPAHLLRLSALQLGQGDLEGARRSADEARTLAPRDLAAIDAGRQVAEQQGDWAAMADRLAEAAALAPESAGQRLLDRARLLADLKRAEEADRGYSEALPRLPPEAALAAEHAQLRRQGPSPIHDLPWSEPLAAFAERTLDPHAAAVAWRDGARLALLQGDLGAALRCARMAYARTQEEPDFAGPLLARVLYRQGSRAEALELHRHLFESGFPGIEERERSVLCRQLAELAEDAGAIDLTLAALEQLLALRPQDSEAAEWRFRLDRDRGHAVRVLAEHASGLRSARRRARALALAATAAHRELADLALADAIWRKAAAAVGDYPKLLVGLESSRLEVARKDYDPAAPTVPTELLSALHDAAAAQEAAQDHDAQRTLLEEAVEVETRHGMLAEAVGDLRLLEEVALSAGQAPVAAVYARRAGVLILERTRDPDRAEVELRRAIRHHRGDELSWRGLEAIARARGNTGALLLAEVIAARAELTQDPAARADLLTSLGRTLAGPLQQPVRAASALRAALALAPDHAIALDELIRVYRVLKRPAELSPLLLDRAAKSNDSMERLTLRREAGELLSALPEEEHRTQAASAFLAALTDAPDDLSLTHAVVKLLLSLGRRDEAIPHLATLVRADPEDEENARELMEAYAGKPREQAQIWIERAARARGSVRATRLREAAQALFAMGEEEQGRALMREIFDTWPADDTAFREAARDAAAHVERLDAILLARARAVPSEAAGCHRTRAEAFAAAGRAEEALAAYQDCLAVAPDDGAALAAVAEQLAERDGDAAVAEIDARLLAIAAASPGTVPPAIEARARYRIGLLAWAQGEPVRSVDHLEKALALAPSDPRAGPAWSAIANGYASRGMGAEALRTARRRVDRAAELDLAEERREALEAGVALSAQFQDQGEDATAMLEGLVALRLGQSPEPDPELDALLERALGAFIRNGENARASALLAVVARGASTSRRQELLTRIGDMALARGDRSACRAAWAEAQTLDPSNAALRKRRLVEARDSGDTAAYASLLEETLTSGERDPVKMLDLARARQALGDPAVAATWYQQLIDIGPSAPGYDEALRAVEAQHPTIYDDRVLAAEHQQRAQEAATPTLQAEEYLAAAASLEQAGVPPGEVRSEIESACAAAPDDVIGWRALADFENRKGEPLAAARAYLALAIRAEGEEAVSAALRAASIFESADRLADALHAYSTAIQSRPGDYAARQALARLAMKAGEPATAAEHLAAIDPSQIPVSDRLEHARACARALDAAGHPADATRLWREVFNADSADIEAYDRLALETRKQRQHEEWLELTGRHDAALAAAGNTARRQSIRCDRARWFEEMGRVEAAEGAWRAALEIDPDFAPAREGLEALLKNSTAWAEASERLRADAEHASLPEEASALHIRRARILQDKLADTHAAAEALAEAEELSAAESNDVMAPAEPTEQADHLEGNLGLEVDLEDLVESTQPPLTPITESATTEPYSHETSPTETTSAPVATVESDVAPTEFVNTVDSGLQNLLEVARRTPGDPDRLKNLAVACQTLAQSESDGDRAAALWERARVANALARWASHDRSAVEPPPLSRRVPAGIRERAAVPGAISAVGRLLSLLAPWLEGLFPADLGRRGATAADRIGPANAPSLLARVESAASALSARSVAVFFSHRADIGASIENTQPPSIILHEATVRALRPSALAFLLARELDLCGAGWALIGKFAPRDVAILCELACRFAEAKPPPLGLPPHRADAFVGALTARVSAEARALAAALGPPAAEELYSFDPRTFATALLQTANRVALLYTGEPHGALEALAQLEPKSQTEPTGGAEARPLSLEALDLYLFALSDLYLELRMLLTG